MPPTALLSSPAASSLDFFSSLHNLSNIRIRGGAFARIPPPFFCLFYSHSPKSRMEVQAKNYYVAVIYTASIYFSLSVVFSGPDSCGCEFQPGTCRPGCSSAEYRPELLSLPEKMVNFVLCLEGKTNKEVGWLDEYSIPFGAISAIIVCNTSGILLEIQSTLRQPPVDNMRKDLGLQYSAGLSVYYGLSVAGHWAYESGVSEYLPQQLSSPNWVKISVNAAFFLQSIISQHMFVTPIHETLDNKFLKLDESMHSRDNIGRLFLLRALLFTTNTTVDAAFPFIGDFVNLFGSFTLVPLTFVFPSLIFLKVKGKLATTTKKAPHVFNVVLFSILAVATTISAIRLIVNNVRHNSFSRLFIVHRNLLNPQEIFPQ